MSRLKDFVSKGVRLIVSDDEAAVPDLEEPEPDADEPAAADTSDEE